MVDPFDPHRMAEENVTKNYITIMTEGNTSNGTRPPMLQIEGKVYDVSEFARRHPGGSIIQHNVGADATDVFHAFHCANQDEVSSST